jgi:hypothetical protein
MFLHGFHIVSSGLRQQPPDETWGLALPGRGNRWLFSTKAVVGVGPTSLQGRRLKPTPVDDIHTCIYIFIYLHIYLFIHTVYMYRKLQNKQHIGNKEMLFFFWRDWTSQTMHIMGCNGDIHIIWLCLESAVMHPSLSHEK